MFYLMVQKSQSPQAYRLGLETFFKGAKKPRGILGDLLYSFTSTATNATVSEVQTKAEPGSLNLPNTAKVQRLLWTIVAPLGAVAGNDPDPWFRPQCYLKL